MFLYYFSAEQLVLTRPARLYVWYLILRSRSGVAIERSQTESNGVVGRIARGLSAQIVRKMYPIHSDTPSLCPALRKSCDYMNNKSMVILTLCSLMRKQRGLNWNNQQALVRTDTRRVTVHTGSQEDITPIDVS